MANPDILIVGAGAAGLMAAFTLSKAGKKVIVLEARDRIGGRIHTLHDDLFFKHAELGAEFVHGNLPITMQLLHEAGIAYISGEGEMWQHRDGKLAKNSWNMPDPFGCCCAGAAEHEIITHFAHRAGPEAADPLN